MRIPQTIVGAVMAATVTLSAHGQVLTYLQTIYDNLKLPEIVELSPDGQFAYVVKKNSITVLSRDATTGTLTFVQEVRNNAFGVEGLNSPQSFTLSPDGNHAYAGDVTSITTFSRDALDGTLTQEDRIATGEQGAGNLTNILSIAVSPDGKDVYAVGRANSGTLSHFSRNAITGTLTIVDTIANNVNGVTNLFSPSSVTLDPTGTHLYLVVTGASRIDVYDRDASTGVITLSGALQSDDPGVSNFSGPQDAVLSPDGKHLYVAARSSSALVVLARDASTGQLTFVTSYRDGDPGGVDGLFLLDSVASTNDGAFVYTASSNDDGISAFERDDTTGLLAYRTSFFNASLPEGGLNGVKQVAISPDGSHIYAAGNFDGAVVVFNAVATKGTLSLIDVHTDFDGNNGADGLQGVERIAISPDGRNVYTASFPEKNIGIYARSADTGRLSYVAVANRTNQSASDDFNPSDIFVSYDGNHLYMISRTKDALFLFDRDPSSGLLDYREVYFDDQNGVANMQNPSRVAGSHDGTIIIVVSDSENGAVFKRDPNTGLLTWAAAMPSVQRPFDAIEDPLKDIFFIEGTDSIAANHGNQVAEYTINPTTGFPTLRDSTSDIPELEFLVVGDVVASPDGLFVYGGQAGNILSLNRNPTTGDLSTLALFDGGDTSIAPSNFGISISPDGEFIFASGSQQANSGIAVFRRDETLGTVDALELFPNGQDNSDGFETAKQTIVSPDSANLYAIGVLDDSLVTFSIGERASLRGKITSNGAPVACAVVELTSTEGELVRTAVTDVNGDYLFTSLATAIYDIRLFGVGVTPSEEGTIDLTGGVEVIRNFTMLPATATSGITGIVTDVDTSEPIVAARVRALIAGDVVSETYTCAGGAYEFSGLVSKGTTTLVDVKINQLNYDSFEQQVSVTSGQVTPANSALLKSLAAIGSLSGFVFGETEADDIALPGAQLILRGPVNISAVAGNDGSYAFGALLPGDYVIRAASEGFQGESFTRSIPAQGAAIKTFRLEIAMSEQEATDLDGDGNVNSVDIQLIINKVLGLPSTINGDVDNSGTVNSVDIQLVILAVLGLL